MNYNDTNQVCHAMYQLCLATDKRFVSPILGDADWIGEVRGLSEDVSGYICLFCKEIIYFDLYKPYDEKYHIKMITEHAKIHLEKWAALL